MEEGTYYKITDILTQVYTCLRTADYSKIDEILDKTNIEESETELIVALLNVTTAYSPYLRNYTSFREQSYTVLKKRGINVNKVFSQLEKD